MKKPPKIKTIDAIALFKVDQDTDHGARTRLANALNIKPQALTGWGEFVPGLRAYQLRDLFPEKFGGSEKQ